VDFLSDGRLELGMGAGWLASEYAAGGWAFDPAPVRIERLEEAVAIVSRLLAGETVTEDGEHYRVQELELYPEPPQGASLPILIGGNGTRLLGVAGRNADIVGFTGFAPRKGGTEPTPTHWTEDGLADRIGVVRDAAGDRFAGIELNLLLQRAVVTDDSRGAAAEVAGEAGFDLKAVLATPFMQFGTPTEIATNLVGLRERLGVSYFTVFGARSEGFQQVVAELAGE
jgi:probable F420-dependent oxidoreductase